MRSVVRKGDEVIVWRLDRLGRTMKDLLALINEFHDKGVSFNSLTESINTNNPTGQLIFHIFASLAEFERNIILERSRAGVLAARARGRKGGRPKKLDPNKRMLAVDMYDSRKYSLAEICDSLEITKPTLYKYIRAAKN